MVLDREEQRGILLELIDKAVFPGAHAEHVVELKKAITEASVKKARK